MLLVVAPDLVVASWARQPIELGHPGFRLAPLVVDFSTIPRLDDASLAHRVPELAVLASLAHKISLGAQLALDAIGDLPEDRRALYSRCA